MFKINDIVTDFEWDAAGESGIIIAAHTSGSAYEIQWEDGLRTTESASTVDGYTVFEV
jgi:hypothetical protein